MDLDNNVLVSNDGRKMQGLSLEEMVCEMCASIHLVPSPTSYAQPYGQYPLE
jgi:hypothetical protein